MSTRSAQFHSFACKSFGANGLSCSHHACAQLNYSLDGRTQSITHRESKPAAQFGFLHHANGSNANSEAGQQYIPRRSQKLLLRYGNIMSRDFGSRTIMACATIVLSTTCHLDIARLRTRGSRRRPRRKRMQKSLLLSIGAHPPCHDMKVPSRPPWPDVEQVRMS